MDGWLKDALGLDSSRGLGTAAGIDDGSLDGSARLEGQQLGRELTASVTSVNSSTDLTSMLSTKGKGRESSKLVAHKPLELKRLSEGWAERGDRRSMGNFTALGNSARKECLSTFCAALESVLDTQQPRLVVVEGRAAVGWVTQRQIDRHCVDLLHDMMVGRDLRRDRALTKKRFEERILL